jgi:hypothetical protein
MELRQALGALGIVYGDIGTPVLYIPEALPTGSATRKEFPGICHHHLDLTLLVTVKYLTFVMRGQPGRRRNSRAKASPHFLKGQRGGEVEANHRDDMIGAGAALLRR